MLFQGRVRAIAFPGGVERVAHSRSYYGRFMPRLWARSR